MRGEGGGEGREKQRDEGGKRECEKVGREEGGRKREGKERK